MVDSRVFLSAELLSTVLTSSVLYFIILHNIAPMFYGKYPLPVSQNQEIPTVDNYNIVIYFKVILTLPMLRLLSSKAHRCKYF